MLDVLYLSRYIFLGAFGLCIGSFLNVVIDRLPLSQNILGRSRSDCCGKTLGVMDLVPIFSYLFLGGKCRFCGQRVSIYYPIIELVSGIITVISFLYFPIPFSVFYAVCFYLLLIFFFTDFKYGLVPVSVFSFGLLFVTVSYIFLSLTGYITFDFILLTYITALVAAGFFIVLILLSGGKGMGFGDVLLAFLFSLFSGFPSAVFTIFLSFILGGFISVLLIIAGKKRFGQTLPFGPFMSFSTVISIFFGQKIIADYISFLLK